MAKTNHNLIVQGLNGGLGRQLIVKHDKFGRTIVGFKPSFDKHRKFTPLQKNHQIAFREAAGVLLEQGHARRIDPLTWGYVTTTTATSAHPTVVAVAQDLPGHVARLEKTK